MGLPGTRSLIFGLLALAGAAAAQKPDPFEDLTSAALEKRVALSALRKEVKADPAAWPKGDVPGLDFTKATGNAIIVHHESGQLSDQALDALMFDFENNARAALWKALKAGFPSAKIPSIVYLDSKE